LFDNTSQRWFGIAPLAEVTQGLWK